MTTTIMESFDAQMLDYQNDLDVPMHVSSSDPWLHDVAPMEDDGHLPFQQKGAMTDSLPTIEVDMEAYVEDEHNEYEMLDDHHGQNLAPGELLDVDVLDASTVPSPLVTVTPLPATPSVEHPSLPPPTDAPPSTELSLPESTPLLRKDAANPALPAVGRTDANPPLPGAPLQENLTSSNDSASERLVSSPQASDKVSSNDEITQQPTVQTSDEPTVNVSPQTDGDSVHNPGPFTSYEDRINWHHTENQTTEPVAENTSQGEAPLYRTPAEHQLAVPGHKPVSDEQLNPSEAANLVHSSEPFEYATNHLVGDGPVQPPDGPVETLNEAINEISADVHLDTPPPILLSIFSTEHPELCLFNKPTDLLPDEDDTQERHILLQQASSLFYDPLTHVFEALRQDEYVSTVLELSGNELALEAYELGLSITEDNYYGREISLHDFCTLHMSANLQGPLRLRLYVAGTRFIIRYHMLQDGFVNLHVDGSHVSEHDESDHSEFDDQQQVEDTYEHDGTDRLELNEQILFESSEDAEGQREVEEHGQMGEYEAPNEDEVTEPAEEQAGEIDLSTLPPFVDSPEVHEEDDQEEGSKSSNDTHLESVVAPEAVRNENLTEEPDELEKSSSAGDLDTHGANVSIDVKEIVSVLEEEASGSEEEYSLEYTLGDETQTVQGDEADAHQNEAYDEITVLKQSEEQTEGTSSLEMTDLTDEAPTEPIEFTAKNTEESRIDHGEEGALDERYPSIDPDAQEDIQDFGEEIWDDELDGEGEPDTTWEAEKENGNESISNESSVTLSSKASKRSFDDFGLEQSDDENTVSESPGPKRVRTE